MGIIWVLLLVAAGWLAYRYVSQRNLTIVRSESDGTHETPEDILKRRLAEGAIDQREFNRIRRTLRS